MALKVKTLNDPNTGDQIAPRTLVEAIVDRDGENLQSTLSNLDTNKASNADLNLVSKRVSNLAANTGEQTEGNAELIDIRVGADGIQYETAGDAVRKQISNLLKKTETAMDRIFSNLSENQGTISTLENIEIVMNKGGFYSYFKEGITEAEGSYYSDYFEVTPKETLFISTCCGYDPYAVNFFDENKKFVSGALLLNGNWTYYHAEKVIVPENAYYCIVNDLHYNGAGVVVSHYTGLKDDLMNLDENTKVLFSQMKIEKEGLIVDYTEVLADESLLTNGFIAKKVEGSTRFGYVADDTASVTTDYIYIGEYPELFVTAYSRFSTAIIGLYDINKNCVATYGHNEYDVGPTEYGDIVSFKRERITAYDLLKISPVCKYIRICSYMAGSSDTKKGLKIEIAKREELVEALKRELAETFIGNGQGNVLYGKKLVACGDSFTAGDFSNYVDSNGNTGRDSDAYDSISGKWKTYPWHIANRNNMVLVNEALCGSVFVNGENKYAPFSTERYKQVPTDADYILLMFGLNEISIATTNLGTKEDTDNTTMWGAYNTVFEYFLTNMPYAKIGVIIPDAWESASHAKALKEICVYWGIPYLDLKGDNVPLGIGGKFSSTSSKAITLRNAAFQVSATDSHPNYEAHKYRSTIIENFLRSL